MVANFEIFFLAQNYTIREIIQLDKLKGTDFNYDNSFLKF